MIKVNLLPVRQWRRKEAVRRQISIFFLTFILLLTVLLTIGIIVRGKLALKRDEIASLEQEKKKLAYVNKKIAEVKKKRTEIENKFSAIEKLQQGRSYAVRAFDEVVTAMPIDRVWLTKMSLSGSSLSLSGVALDNHTVALFMRRLDHSPMVASVALSATKKKNIMGKDLMDFSLSIRLR